MTLSASEVNELKRAPAVEGVLPVLLERWSPRSFAEREVSPADLKRLFEAARWAASSNNSQPWRYIVAPRNWPVRKKIESVLGGTNKEWAPKVPVLILGTTHTKNVRGGVNAYAFFDLGAATTYLTLAATALGLVTHQMAGYDHEAARQVLGIPEDYTLGSIIALGHQGEPSALASEELIERETSPRVRKPLSEMVFSAWGEPAKLW